MIVALVFCTALLATDAGAPAAAAPPAVPPAVPGVAADDTCRDTYDRTATCASPAATTAPDTQSAAPVVPRVDPLTTSRDPNAITSSVAAVGTLIGIGGGALIAASFTGGPPFSRTVEPDDVRPTVLRIGGAAVLGTSALVLGTAVVLSAFNPSSGTLRWQIFPEGTP